MSLIDNSIGSKYPAVPPEIRAVVLAGGKGKRLKPYTTIFPKPLLPVGDKPILEYVFDRILEAGISKVTISVGHLAELIQTFFGDGAKWNLEIKYAIEDKPLNTIGPLLFVEDLGENFFVINGDILTNLDLRCLWKRHIESKAALTVATFRRSVNIDFGVVRFNERNGTVYGFEEKPVLFYNVSMGAYVLNRRCLNFIPKGEPFGFDQLILALLAAKQKVHSYSHSGTWLDIGRPDDYEAANKGKETSEW